VSVNGAGRAARHRPPVGRWIAVVVAAVAVVALIVVLAGEDDDPATVTRSPGAAEGPEEPTRLAFVVTGGAEPAVAMIGAGGDLAPAAFVLPPSLTMVVPGAGELEVRETALLPLEEMRMGLSNGMGAWSQEAARIDLDDLVAGLGDVPLTVNLPTAETLGGVAIGPGEVELTPTQVGDLLAAASEDPDLRWDAILTALLASPDRIPLPTEATDAEAATTVLLGARGADPVVVPTELVAGTLLVPAQPRLDDDVATAFGTEAPVPVEVRNGSGVPGAGGAVGEAIVPIGYRVVLSGNAETFDVQRTEIVANGVDHQPEAQAIRDALGVGTVRVSQVPSGIADVTIVIGADLS